MEAVSPSPVYEQGWSSLPADLLRDILARLPWSSHPRFAATCKHWSTIVSSFYPAWLTPVLLNAVDIGSTNLRYYSPYYDKIFEIAKTLNTPDAKICCANRENLTLYYRKDRYIIVVHANLATGFIQELKPLHLRHTFDFVIDDGEHNMFGIRAFNGTLEVARNVLRNDDSFPDWEFSEFSPEDPEFGTSFMTNPVFHRGLLYMLGEDGRLATYDKRRHEEGFKILDKPVEFNKHIEDFEFDDFYLFESDEAELMALLADRRGSPLYVVKLNEDVMEWEKVESLEGRALFTGTLRTMMVNTDVSWMQNKIFFPRLHQWPDIIHCDLVDRDGELAFVPKSKKMAAQDGGADGKNIWTCGLGKDESAEFWGSANFNYSIWVNFEKLTR